jgi:hypothetical protein
VTILEALAEGARLVAARRGLVVILVPPSAVKPKRVKP